jgi:DNA-binding NtrC family response regulator
MLRFDRYLVTRSHAIDLATGCAVAIVGARADDVSPTLFTSRAGRLLIDLECSGERRYEVWEPSPPLAVPIDLRQQHVTFVEVLECARSGAPRAFDLLPARAGSIEYLTRALAREARVRGWVPIDLAQLAAQTTAARRGWPAWLADRSLVVFAAAERLSREAVIALLRLARRDTRPHVVVRTLGQRVGPVQWRDGSPAVPLVHEQREGVGAGTGRPASAGDLTMESAARWAVLLDDLCGRDTAPRALDLAQVLMARAQTFEARALIERAAPRQRTPGSRAAVLIEQLDADAAARAADAVLRAAGRQVRGIDMIDEFVGVLQLCQDVEDERTALARVGAYLRERLQASSVAFIAREGRAPRVLMRTGSEAAPVDLALRTMDTGVAIHPITPQGPAESACPVRHATEVIGVLWCRWNAGMPVAADQAATLLGIAAAAAAPSMRLALTRLAPLTDASNPVPELIGDSEGIRGVRTTILRAAASPFPVLIEGESGSGKELAARAIHARGPRRERKFCAINCAALVDELVEAELFGHTRGAFTGAHAERAGMFEEASHGTLFLDEVAELGSRVQAKLLRTLQEGEVRRIGEAMLRKVDVRIVAATNRPLAEEVKRGRFRADLWYRLDVIRVVIPPLRERLEDLPALTAHLWHGLAARTGSRASLSRATMSALSMYDWPGNIRELQNVLASLMVAAPRTGVIAPSALPAHLTRASALARGATLAHARRQFDERFVRAALARAGGRTAIAARELGVSRQGLAKLMSRLGISDARMQMASSANVE